MHPTPRRHALPFVIATIVLLVGSDAVAQQWERVTLRTDHRYYFRQLIETPDGVLIARDISTYHRSSDEGRTWSEHGFPDSLAPESFMIGSRGELLVVRETGLSASTDGGLTWTERSRYPADWEQQRTLGATRASDGRLVVASYPVGLIVSDDDGATWTTLPGFEGAQIFGIVATDADTWCVGASDSLRRTTDAGATWHVLRAREAAHFTDPSTPGPNYALTVEGLIRSSDDGTSWSFTNAIALRGRPIALLKTSSLEAIVGTDQGTISHTTDGGSTWQAFDDGIEASPPSRPRGLWSLVKLRSGALIIAGDNVMYRRE